MDIDNIPKVGIANRGSLTWAVVHGLTMLVLDGLANVEQLSIERIAQKVVTTTLRGLARTWSLNKRINNMKYNSLLSGLYSVCSCLAVAFIGARSTIERRDSGARAYPR